MSNVNKVLGFTLFFMGFGLHGTTNQTFLANRPASVNLVIEQPAWHNQINKIDGKDSDKFGANLQVTFFSQSADNIEAYFGFDRKSQLVVGPGNTFLTDVDRQHIIHNDAGAESTLSGTLHLGAEHQAYGIRLDLYQNLDCIIRGIYLKARVPLIGEENKSTLSVEGSVAGRIDNSAGVEKTLRDYFDGVLSQTADAKQTALTYGRMGRGSNSFGVADIDVVLGFNWYKTANHHAGINLGLTIPTGVTPEGRNIFESVGGSNRGHWGLGGGLDVKYRPWVKKHQNLEVLFLADFRHLLSGGEQRILGIKNKNWGHYMLVAAVGATGVQPAANILRQTLSVHPGNQLDLLLGMAYNNGGLCVDAGYNLYAREKERAYRVDSWNDALYAFAGNDYDSSNAFTLAGAADKAAVTISNRTASVSANTNNYITSRDLDLCAAETPAQTTHKFYVSTSYAFNTWKYPLALKAGGFYELGTVDESLESVCFFAGFSVSF